MSDYCEICESVAVATSSCPATDMIMVLSEVASASSLLVAAPQPQGVIVSTGASSSAVVIDAYALLLSSANAVSVAEHTMVITELLQGSAVGSSTVVQSLYQLIVEAVNATDTVLVAEASHTLFSDAHAVSSVVSASTVANMLLKSKSEAASSVFLGLLEIVASAANATGTVAALQRQVDVVVASFAAATSSATPSTAPVAYLLVSMANGTSDAQTRTDVMLYASSSAEAVSDVWYKDPTSKAWVMNTETTALGWYDNFSFESIVSWRGRELAVGPDGIHELAGSTDNGQQINAFVESGFTDFGAVQTKRLDNMYFGYTSDGQIVVKTEVYESGFPPTTYLLEERAANAPRNSRVTPGKGLWGRYWRLTISNVGGAGFEVHDATVDIATSTRRI